MQIECILKRPGGTVASIDRVPYHFQPVDPNDESTPHVAEVANKTHAERFLQIPEGYRIYKTEAGEEDLAAPPQQPAQQTQEAPQAPPESPETEPATEMVGEDEEPEAEGPPLEEPPRVSEDVKAHIRGMGSLEEIQTFVGNAGIDVHIPGNMKPANAAEKVIAAMEGGDANG